ncbi:MAG: hypothetical protein ACK5LZ_01045 [Anaerorhabdus sp.]
MKKYGLILLLMVGMMGCSNTTEEVKETVESRKKLINKKVCFQDFFE